MTIVVTWYIAKSISFKVKHGYLKLCSSAIYHLTILIDCLICNQSCGLLRESINKDSIVERHPKYIKKSIETDRQTDRQTGRQNERQIDR